MARTGAAALLIFCVAVFVNIYDSQSQIYHFIYTDTSYSIYTYHYAHVHMILAETAIH